MRQNSRKSTIREIINNISRMPALFILVNRVMSINVSANCTMSRRTRNAGSLLIVLMALVSYMLCQPLLSAFALDMTQIQATFQKMGGRPQALLDWQKLLHDAKDLPINDKLKRINEFFNRHITFGEDIDVWGQEDYWATPMESLSKGKGDCEDYVIAKYFVLRELNVPDQQLRLIYVKARIGGPDSTVQQAHMILAYYPSPDVEPLVLDNLITDIRPASRRPDLQPIFSFNSQGIYAGVAANSAVGPGGVGRLSRWADLLQRAHAEGF
jgi:predicted transglutaminase-like cysteine proteinase